MADRKAKATDTARENVVRLEGGHHDGRELVVQPWRDRIELAWAEVGDWDQRVAKYSLEGALYDANMVPVSEGPVSTSGHDVYYRDPLNRETFLFDDGADYRLARYKVEEARAETAKYEAERAQKFVTRDKVEALEKEVAELRSIVGRGVERMIAGRWFAGGMTLSSAVSTLCSCARMKRGFHVPRHREKP